MFFQDQKTLTFNAGMNLISQISSVLFPLVTFPYISRILLPEGLGRVNFAQAIVGYFTMFASMGIPLYGIREVAKCRDYREKLSTLAAELFFLRIITVTLSCAAFGIFMYFSKKALEDPILFLICSIPLLIVPVSFDWIFSGTEEFSYIAVRTLVVRLLVATSIFVFIKDFSDFRKYALIMTLNVSVAGLLNLFFIRRHIGLGDIRWDCFNFMRHIKAIGIAFLIHISYKLYSVIDKSMLGYFVDFKEVGYYVAAERISFIGVMFIASIVTVLLPRVSYNIATDKENFQAELTNRSFRFIFNFSTFTTGFTLLGAPIIIDLFLGNEYNKSINILAVMSFCITAIAWYHFVLYQIIYPTGKDIYIFFSIGTGVLVNLVMNYLLIPTLFGLGAGISTVISQYTICICVAIMLYKINRTLFKSLIYKSIKYLMIMSGALIMAVSFIAFDKSKFIMPIVFTIGYVTILYISKDEIIPFINSKFKLMSENLIKSK